MDLTNQLIDEAFGDKPEDSEQDEAALQRGIEKYADVIAECKKIAEPYALLVAHSGGVSIYNNCADAADPHSLDELTQLTLAMAYGVGGIIGDEQGDDAVFSFAGRLAAAAVDE